MLRPDIDQACTPAGHHFFANNGFAVWTFDVHGHGASEPFGERDRVAIRQFDHLVDDCEQFLTEVVTPWADELAPGTPIILNGTSMGGLAVRLFSSLRGHAHSAEAPVLQGAENFACVRQAARCRAWPR